MYFYDVFQMISSFLRVFVVSVLSVIVYDILDVSYFPPT